MKVLAGQQKDRRDPRSVTGQRKGLLAKIHVARAQTMMSAIVYEDILRERFGVATASTLSIGEMEKLVAVFIDEWGWVPKYHKKHGPSQVAALQERIWEVAGQLDGGKERLKGLCLAVCGVDQVAWCQDWKKLQRLVAVLEKIKRQS